MTTGVTIVIGANTRGAEQGFARTQKAAERFKKSADGPVGDDGQSRKAGEKSGEAYSQGFMGSVRQGIGQGIGQTLANLPVAAAGAAIEGLTSAVGGSLQVFRDFDAAMTRAAVISGSSAADMKELRAEVKRLGSTTSLGAGDIANMTVALSRAGFSAQDSKAALEGIVRGSEATGASLEDLASVGGGLIKAFGNVGLTAGSAGLQVSDMQGVMDSLVVTANSVNSDVTGLGFGMRNLAAQANSTGQPLNDMLTALGLLQDSMLAGESGGTALSTSLRQISDLSAGGGSDAAQGFWADLGINARDANNEMRPLLDILPELRQKLSEVAPSERDLIISTLFGADGGKAIQILLSKTQEEIDALNKKVNEGAGTSVKAGEQMQAGLGGALAQLSSAMEGLALQFGGAIAPAVEGFAKLISSFLGQFNESGAFDALQAGFEQVQQSLEAIAADEELMAGVSQAIAEIVKALGQLTADGLEAMARWLAENAAAIPAVAQGFQDIAMRAVDIAGNLGPVIGFVVNLLGYLFKIQTIIVRVFGFFGGPVLSILSGALGAISEKLSQLIGFAEQLLGLEAVMRATGGAAEGSAKAFGEAAEKIKKFGGEGEKSAEGVQKGTQAATQATKEGADERVKVEADAAQKSLDIARQGGAQRLQALESANANAESELQRAAEQEQAIEAKKQKELDDLRARQAERRGAQEQGSLSQEISIRRRQLSGGISEGEADALISQKSVTDAQAAIGVIKEDIADLNEVRAQGHINEKEFIEQSTRLQEELARNNLTLVNAELTEKKRVQQEAIRLIEEEGEAAKMALDDRVQALNSVSEGLKQQASLLGAASDLQGALADQENARLDAAMSAATTEGERRKVEAAQAAAKVEQLMAAQAIEQQQLALSQAQANADLERQGVLAEIAQLEAEIALEKLKASGATEQEIAAQERILSLRKKQVSDLGKAAAVQQGIQALQGQTLAVRQSTARQRLGTELRNSGRESSAPSASGAANAVVPGPGSSRRSPSGFSDEEQSRLAQGDRVRGLRVITPESVSANRPQVEAGVGRALKQLNQGGGGAGSPSFEKAFKQIQASETSRVVDELKALHEAVREGNAQGQVPQSLTIQSPEPVQDATKIIRDLSRRSTR